MSALAVWSVGAVAFASLPAGSNGQALVVSAVYVAVATLAGLAIMRAMRTSDKGAERVFWVLLGIGMLVGFVGDLGWGSLQEGGLPSQDISLQHGAYLVSYLILVGAMMRLVHSTTNNITLVTFLDAHAIMLSVGLLAWYFFLGGYVEESGGASGAMLAALSWPLFDAALLFLALVTLSTPRNPPFAGPLAAGFLLFAVADGSYLVLRAQGSYNAARWPDLVWALGLLFFGLAALRAGPADRATDEKPPIAPWRVLAFWLGPLSPPVHLGVLLLLGALRPPLPAYASAGAAVLFVYLAVRTGLVSFVTRRLMDEHEEAARRLEQGRVLQDLHETVKQSTHGLSLTLGSALEAERRGEREAARDLLENALRSSRELEFKTSRPYDELQAADGESLLRPGDFLRHRLNKFQEYFGVKTHDDLRAPLEDLSPAEIAVVHRVTVEAFWNVAKHSKARNMWLDSRRVGTTFVVRVRDDGRGFDANNPPPGLGLRYMRRRAEEAGARLDIISTPGSGATIQLRFDRRR